MLYFGISRPKGGIADSPSSDAMGEKEVKMQQPVITVAKLVRMRCPECLNFMNAKNDEHGSIKGTCPVCKSTIFSKQHSVNVRLLKIVRHTT